MSYKKCCGINSDEKKVTNGDTDQSASALGMAIRAQLHALHPRLAPPNEDKDFELDQEDIANTTTEGLRGQVHKPDMDARAKRLQWLNDLEEWDIGVFHESAQVTALTNFLCALKNTPSTEKVIIMSQYLKYLDIVAKASLKLWGITCLRYDGTVS